MYFGRKKGHESSTNATGEGIQRVRSGEGGVTPHVYVRTYTSVFMVLAAFLSLFCHLFYLQKFSLTFS